MTRQIARILLVFLLAVPLPLYAQKAPEQFVVFIHSGPKATNDPLVVQIAVGLVRQGFIVRAPDDLRDLNGAPHVDYFSESAADAAQAVVDVVNTAKQSSSNLSAEEKKKTLTRQLQKINNPSTYLGVWLF